MLHTHSWTLCLPVPLCSHTDTWSAGLRWDPHLQAGSPQAMPFPLREALGCAVSACSTCNTVDSSFIPHKRGNTHRGDTSAVDRYQGRLPRAQPAHTHITQSCRRCTPNSFPVDGFYPCNVIVLFVFILMQCTVTGLHKINDQPIYYLFMIHKAPSMRKQ